MTDENAFNRAAEMTLQRIPPALEEVSADCDCEVKGDGILEIEFSDGSRIVVNRHSAAREIWVAAKSGGYHFRWNGARWIDSRSGEELFASLSKAVSAQSGEPVILKAG